MSRFDYIKYDEKAQKMQAQFKEQMQAIETHSVGAMSAISELDKMVVGLPDSRAKKNILDKLRLLNETDIGDPTWLNHLEEVYMWVGKAIRDEQISRDGKAELQEERGAE